MKEKGAVKSMRMIKYNKLVRDRIPEMKCYLCTVGQGGYVLKEHQDARWLSRDTIDEVEWLPADLGLIKKVKEWLP